MCCFALIYAIITLFKEKKMRAGIIKISPVFTSSLPNIDPIKFLDNKTKKAIIMEMMNESRIPADNIALKVSGSDEHCDAWRKTDK